MHVLCRRKGDTLQLFSDLSSGYMLLISVNLLTFQGYSKFSKEVLMNIYRCYRLWKTRFSRPKNRKKRLWNPCFYLLKPSISGAETKEIRRWKHGFYNASSIFSSFFSSGVGRWTVLYFVIQIITYFVCLIAQKGHERGFVFWISKYRLNFQLGF